jgi:phage tail sheath gpL-like
MSGVPSNIILPIVGIDFDGSQAQSIDSDKMPVNVLVIGQRLATGTVAAKTKYLATSAEEVAIKSGRGSMLHKQAQKLFKNNNTVPVTFVGLDDATSSTAGKAVVTFSGTATSSGTLSCYLYGTKYAVSVASGDAAAAVATALVAAINADVNTYASASASSATVTVTAGNKGIAAGDIDLRFNDSDGEQFPAGISAGSVTVTAGTVDPDIADALATIGDSWYNVIVNPYTDDTNLTKLEELLATNDSATIMHTSVAIQATRKTRNDQITYNTNSNRNSQYIANFPAYKRCEATWEIASAIAGAVAASVQDDPAKPLHRLTLKGLRAQNINDRWTFTERNLVAINGGGTLTDDLGVALEATVTMYLKNSAGAPDTAYQYMNTMFTLSAVRYLFVNAINRKYARAKLSKSRDGIGPGELIMTEATAEAEAISWFLAMRNKAYFEGGADVLKQFKDELVVKISGNRVEWLLPPDLINQFIVGSGTIRFKL